MNLKKKTTFPNQPTDAINNYFIQIIDRLNTKHKNKFAAFLTCRALSLQLFLK